MVNVAKFDLQSEASSDHLDPPLVEDRIVQSTHLCAWQRAFLGELNRMIESSQGGMVEGKKGTHIFFLPSRR